MQAKELVILGNGFDLRLGLKSSFSDFYNNTQLLKVENWIRNPNDLKTIREINYISLLLYYTFYSKKLDPKGQLWFQKRFRDIFGINEGIADWMNVEGFVEKILTSPRIKESIRTCDIVLSGRDIERTWLFLNGDSIIYYISKVLLIREYKDIDYYQFVFKELQLFEKDFSKYLLEEVSNKDSNYSVNRPDLLRYIVQPHNYDIEVLNFNYTSPKRFEFPELNIHGKLVDENIIIGIDFKDNRDLNVLPFTKTYRKLLSTKVSNVLNGHFDEIIIYGHSLGRQDYSYFQSIFDYVDLYGGKTVVRFVYSDYFKKDDNEKDDLKKEKANSLFSLIEEYGNTLDNKDNGKNLLHKLLLEGRIRLELNNFDAIPYPQNPQE